MRNCWLLGPRHTKTTVSRWSASGRRYMSVALVLVVCPAKLAWVSPCQLLAHSSNPLFFYYQAALLRNVLTGQLAQVQNVRASWPMAGVCALCSSVTFWPRQKALRCRLESLPFFRLSIHVNSWTLNAQKNKIKLLPPCLVWTKWSICCTLTGWTIL